MMSLDTVPTFKEQNLWELRAGMILSSISHMCRTAPFAVGHPVFSCCGQPVTMGSACFISFYLYFRLCAPLASTQVSWPWNEKQPKHFLELLKALEKGEFLSWHSQPPSHNWESRPVPLSPPLGSWETWMRPQKHFKTVYSDWATLWGLLSFPYKKRALTFAHRTVPTLGALRGALDARFPGI